LQKIGIMIKVGDKIKFLNEVGGGVVTSFINKNMVNVENEDGFEIPCPISELLNISAPELSIGGVSDEKLATESASIPEPIYATPAGELINGKNSADFYFCFVPTDSRNPLAGEIELYLVNDSNYTVMFHYSHYKNEGVETVKYGNVQSNSNIILESFVQNELSDLPDFGFQLLYFKDEDKELQEPITKKFKVNPVKFYKETSFQSNQYFKRNALILQITKNILSTELDKLTQSDFKKVVREKEGRPRIKKQVQKRTAEIVEIDLHINELLDNSEGLSNRDILGIQTDKVASEMKLAIQSGAKKIVFIHGVGQGVLKQEVANLLKSKFKKYYYQDASFKEYGYGATMVTIRKG
jgi:DNA-nicking Smr family endonuclease